MALAVEAGYDFEGSPKARPKMELGSQLSFASKAKAKRQKEERIKGVPQSTERVEAQAKRDKARAEREGQGVRESTSTEATI